jgi:hypothetical protein
MVAPCPEKFAKAALAASSKPYAIQLHNRRNLDESMAGQGERKISFHD